MPNKKRRAKMLITGIIFVVLFIFLLAGHGAANEKANLPGFIAFRPEIRIFVNDLEMETENPLFMLQGRIFLPARSFMEALDATVEWNPATGVVTAILGQKCLEFPVGMQEARLNGAAVQMDAPARIIAGRAYLPLRFLIESLGGTVHWEEKEYRVDIALDGAALIPYLPGGLKPEDLPSGPDPYSDIDFEVQTEGIRIGDTASRVLQVLGAPARREETIYGYQWWTYNRDPLNHVQVGIENDRAVALYIYGDTWSFGPVKAGDRLQELEKHFETADGLFLEENKTLYKFIRPVLLYPGLAATFYYDSGENDALVALRLEERETAGEQLKQFFQFRSEKGDREAFNSEKMREAEAADERQLFDLVNAARAREGLPSLGWHEAAAMAGRKHSREMYLHDYFSHVSAVTGENLGHRLDAEQVDFVLGAENIARGQMDALEVHHDLMNSPEHRKNILHPDLFLLGVGVYGDCFTQDYVTLR